MFDILRKKLGAALKLSVDRVLNTGHFVEKSCRKCAPKTSSRPPFNFAR